MKRLYYISADLNDLEAIVKELESRDVSTPQIHVLSENDADVEKHHLHAIEAVLKQDVVRSTTVGALIGVACAAVLLMLAYFLQWHITAAGWVPFIFLAVVLLGFCSWEGGLIGIQMPNYQFKRFQKLLKHGKHVFFVDISPEQESVLTEIVEKHPRLKFAGEGEATPGWVVHGQEKFHKVMKTLP
tara:strand:- start:5384 stop:5941 length:558 start_codon:yes stop_codon:yes gene_type:complete